MNSNWKLLSAGLLVAALAGCGGGSGSDDMTMTPATPEEECEDAGNNWYQGACYTDEELVQMGVQQGKDDAADAAALAKAMADAKALLGVLSSDGDGDATPVIADPSQINPAAAAGTTLYADAKADMKGKMAVPVMGKKFSEVYEASGGAVTGTAVSGISATGVLSFTAGTADANIMASDFSTSGPKTHRKTSVRGTTIYYSTSGSYHGVPGTYECAGAAADACSSQVAPDGSGNVQLTGTWTFTATSVASNVMDSNGVEYGWWAVPGGAGVAQQAHVFFNTPTGGLVARNTLPADHGGTATYTGNALGHYAIHRGESGTNDSGTFSAEAELTAVFGASASIAGIIDNFMGADGASRDWMVELKKIDTAPTDGLYSGTNNVVWTIGSDASADGGSWQVRAYGGGEAAATAGDPAAVAGGFQAEHGIMNARMIGAFGAGKDE